MSEPPRRRGPRAGEDTRAAILAAARAEFARVGYDATSLRGVARLAGVDPALVHHYFFPLTVMVVVTSVATLRERASGTLERLLSTPLGRFDFLGGYAVAFGVMAVLQALIASAFAIWVCGLDIAGPLWWLPVVSVASGLSGTALGLLASAFARTEFQAVQFMPALILPQVLLCGLIVPRDQMPRVLEVVSAAMPMSHAVDALTTVSTQTDPGADVIPDLGVLAAFVVAALALAALTLRRRTP